MSSFLDIIESGLAFVKSNPVVQEYAEPILKAVLTGSSTIALPYGTISVSQTGGTPAKFTFGSAGLALETFIFTGDVDFTIGTTEFKFIPNGTPVAPVSQSTAATTATQTPQ